MTDIIDKEQENPMRKLIITVSNRKMPLIKRIKNLKNYTYPITTQN